MPLVLVSKESEAEWLGRDPKTAKEHYLRVTGADFAKATESPKQKAQGQAQGKMRRERRRGKRRQCPARRGKSSKKPCAIKA